MRERYHKTSAEIRLTASLGPWQLDRKKVGRIALINRVEDRSGSGQKFDFIINRQFEFTVLADVEGWRDWALPMALIRCSSPSRASIPRWCSPTRCPTSRGRSARPARW